MGEGKISTKGSLTRERRSRIPKEGVFSAGAHIFNAALCNRLPE
jgi:hypothetical protein